MAFKSLLPYVLLLPTLAHAAYNDWNTPCLNGTCAYDVGNSTHPVNGAVILNGTQNALSDLTEAAGWHILDVNSTGTEHHVRAVCVGQNSTCSHVYQNGIENTVVRLPQNVTTYPFARVVKEWQHDNQTVPSHVAAKLSRRDGEPQSLVRGITLDADWHSIDPSQHGQVGISIFSRVGNSAVKVTDKTTRDLDSRGFLSELGNKVEGAVNSVVNDVEQATTVDWDRSGSIPYDQTETFTLLDLTQQCNNGTNLTGITQVKAEVSVAVTTTLNGAFDWDIAIVGTVVPPDFTSFSFGAGWDGDVTGKIAITATAMYTLTTDKHTIFNYDLSPLSIDGLINIGPAIQIQASASGSISANAVANIEYGYNIDGIKLAFPPSDSSAGTWTPLTPYLGLDVDSTISGNLTGSIHLVPGFVFGISAFNDDPNAKIEVRVDLDVYGEVDLSLYLDSQPAIGGVADVYLGLLVSATATGKLYTLWSDTLTIQLYKEKYELFHKTFSQALRREHARDLLALPPAPRADPASSLKCFRSYGQKHSLSSLDFPISLSTVQKVED